MLKEHPEDLGKVVINHQEISCVTSLKEWILLLKSF